MTPLWKKHLPVEYAAAIIVPVWFRTVPDVHDEGGRTFGYWYDASRCFYQFERLVCREQIGADQLVIRRPLFYEQIKAWRLHDGRWLRVRGESEHGPACRKRYRVEGAEVVEALTCRSQLFAAEDGA